MLVCLSQKVNGQIISADIGVNGLTCSQCTRTVEMSLRKLDCVDNVQMNLEQTSGHIVFKEGRRVDLEEIADAVTHAGFSVRYLYAQINFDSVVVSQGSCYLVKGHFFQLVRVSTKNLSGQVTVKLEGKKYMPTKDYRKIKTELKPKCANTVQKEFFISLQ